MRRPLWLLAAVILFGLWAWSQSSHDGAPPRAPAAPFPAATAPTPREASVPAATWPEARYPAFLPHEAHAVLDAIARGGPYAYRQDGGTFANRERRLPAQPRDYYREYTVPTPGSGDRGPRRIVTGGGRPGPPHEYWYSADHYRSFRRFDVPAPVPSR
jgi:guanyl-specific ribonuclease Sa